MIQAGIEVFLAIIRNGGLSKAAQELYLTQPTVSKRLMHLEDEIGVPLFERHRGSTKVALTPAGEAFLDVAERWAAIYKEVESLGSMPGKLTLNVGSSSSVNYEWANLVFTKLLRREPPLCLKIITSSSPSLYAKVEQRIIDVGLVRAERAHPNVVVEKLYSSCMVGLCLPSSPFANKKGVHPHELKPEDEFFAPVDAGYQTWHDKWWPSLCPERAEVDSIHLVMDLMCEPRNWALVPEWVARNAVSRSGFATFTLSDKTPERACYMITHKHPKKSAVPALEIFDLCLKETLARA